MTRLDITTPSDFHIQYHTRPQDDPRTCIQCIRESWSRAIRERDEARAALAQAAENWKDQTKRLLATEAALAEARDMLWVAAPNPAMCREDADRWEIRRRAFLARTGAGVEAKDE